MKIISVEPRDIVVRIEFTIGQMYFIHQYLGRCTCEYNTAEHPFMEDAGKYIEKDFMPALNKLMKEMGETDV